MTRSDMEHIEHSPPPANRDTRATSQEYMIRIGSSLRALGRDQTWSFVPRIRIRIRAHSQRDQLGSRADTATA